MHYVQVLADLPPFITVTVLGSVLDSGAACGVTAEGGGPARSADRFSALLQGLPRSLHVPLLRAREPSIDASRSLSISHRDAAIDAASFNTAANTLWLRTQLTSLSLHSICWDAVDPHDPSAADPISKLSTMTALRELQLTDADAAMPHVFTVALADALPALPSLARLSLAGTPRFKDSRRYLLSRLPVLRTLRSLDVSGCRIDGSSQSPCPESVPELNAVLHALGDLTHLSVARNPLADGGWAALRRAAAALPLRRLELQHCDLTGAFRMFDADDEPPGVHAFAALEHLNLSGNADVCLVADVLSSVQRLTSLWLEGVGLCAGATGRQRLLSDLGSRGPHMAVIRDLRAGWLEWTGEQGAGSEEGTCLAKLACCSTPEGFTQGEGRQVFASALPLVLQPTLQYVDISASLGDGEAVLLTRALADLPLLTFLSVCSNPLEDAPQREFLRGIGMLTTLQSLKLMAEFKPLMSCHEADLARQRAEISAVNFHPLGAGFMLDDGSSGLETLERLECLQLVSWLNSRSLVCRLARWLPRMPRLTDIALQREGLGAASLRYLVPALCLCKCMAALDLSVGALFWHRSEALEAGLPYMPALRTLSIRMQCRAVGAPDRLDDIRSSMEVFVWKARALGIQATLHEGT